MKIDTIKTYNTNFTAINDRILNIAKQEHSIMNTVSGDLIEKLQFDILTKKISYQDGIDTVNALLPYTKKKYHNLYEPIIEFCKSKLKTVKTY